MENFEDTWKGIVTKTARYTARDYPDIEEEDLQQELYALILKAGWTDPTDQTVVAVLRRMSNVIAQSMRTQNLSLSAQYSYRTSEVREILWKVFDHEDWPRRSIPVARSDDGHDVPQWGLLNDQLMDREGFEAQQGQFNMLPKAGSLDGEEYISGGISRPSLDFDDRLCAFADVKQAWQYLPKQYKQAIVKRYGLGWEFDGDADRQRCTRAVNRLTDILNWYRGRG